jgi:hypothetical protein
MTGYLMNILVLAIFHSADRAAFLWQYRSAVPQAKRLLVTEESYPSMRRFYDVEDGWLAGPLVRGGMAVWRVRHLRETARDSAKGQARSCSGGAPAVPLYASIAGSRPRALRRRIHLVFR